MSEVPEVAPVPTRFPVEVAMVRRLVEAQFPQWADLPIQRVAEEGWDNHTFHLGREMLVRLPSASPYALAVDKEQRWLPILAPQLPLPIPVPLAKGVPGEGYPHAWSIYRWLPGETASGRNISDLTRFGTAVAGFIAALQAVDATAGPVPGQHNWFRGGPLRTYDRETQRHLETLDGRVRVDLAKEIWECALRSEHDQRPVWFHGDVAVGNLLVDDGELVAVIDFGTCGVGDLACDLAIAWTLLAGESREAFRDRLAVDRATWARGRGWALWKALAGCAGAVRDGEPEPRDAKSTLTQIFDEYQEAS